MPAKRSAAVLILSICFFLWGTGWCFPEEITITVKGNARTKTRFVGNIVRDYLERNAIVDTADVDAAALRDLILNKELFSEVKVGVSPGRIDIQVKDRWTLIPIPIVNAESDQDTRYGLFLYERNFLGYGKTVVLGGMFSRSQSTYFGLYEDPEIGFSDWLFRVQASRSADISYQYRRDEKVFGDDRLINSGALTLGYQWSSDFLASTTLRAEQFHYRRLSDAPVPDDYRIIKGELDLEWDRSRFRFYYKDGFRAQVELEHQLYRSDSVKKAYAAALMVNAEKTLFRRQALQLQLTGMALEKGDQRDLIRVGSQRGFRGVPDSGAWVDRCAAAAFDYQIPLWFAGFGTWTVAPFVDTGYLNQRGHESDQVTFSAAGIGTYIYLKNIALPGLGVHVGCNDTFFNTFFDFTIGFAF